MVRRKLSLMESKTLGGIDQVQLRNNYGVYRRGRWHRITERLKYDDALAIEAEVPNIRFVFAKKNERYRILVTTAEGRQARPILEGVTADYAPRYALGCPRR